MRTKLWTTWISMPAVTVFVLSSLATKQPTKPTSKVTNSNSLRRITPWPKSCRADKPCVKIRFLTILFLWTNMLMFTIFAIFSGRNSNSWKHPGFDAWYNYVLATLEKIGSQRSCQVTSWWHAEYTAFKKDTFLLFLTKRFDVLKCFLIYILALIQWIIHCTYIQHVTMTWPDMTLDCQFFTK